MRCDHIWQKLVQVVEEEWCLWKIEEKYGLLSPLKKFKPVMLYFRRCRWCHKDQVLL